MVPAEILQKIFTHLSYWDIYRMRSVSKTWKVQCEYHIYLLMKSRQQKLFIKIGEKGSTILIDMLPYAYDSDNQVIEFRRATSDGEETTLEGEDDDDVYIYPKNSRRTQILFSEWSEKSVASLGFTQKLTLADRALVMFHLRYNPSMEQVYQIPAPRKEKNRLQYMGDKGMIMCYSYIHPSVAADENAAKRPAIQFRGVEDWVSPSLFDDDALSSASNSPPPVRLRVHAIYVNLSWLLAGMISDITTQPIYTKRYEALNELLDEEGIKQYSPYSQSVLEYIMEDHYYGHLLKEQKKFILIQEKTKCEEIQQKLQAVGIDPRVIWKYTFAKNFILREQNNIKSADVARVIQKSEEEWVIKKLELYRQQLS